MGSCCIAPEAPPGALGPRWVGWAGGEGVWLCVGKEVQKGGYICTHIVDSCFCMTETNTTL